MKLYSPRDQPTYEQESDARFERDQLQPCIHQGEPSRPRWVPQVEYHPGPPYRSMPRSSGREDVGCGVRLQWPLDTESGRVIGADFAKDADPEWVAAFRHALEGKG